MKSIISAVIVFLAYLILIGNVRASESQAPLSCKARLIRVSDNYQLPYKNDGTEIVNSTNIDRKGRYIYTFDIQNNTATKPIILTKVVMQQLHQSREPLTLTGIAPQDYVCNQNSDKSVVCSMSYSFFETANSPIYFLVDFDATNFSDVNTSTLFYLETSVGNTQCASYYTFKDDLTSKHPLSWETPYASLKADNLAIHVDNKVYYGVEPISIHSDPAEPGEKTTTLEAIWKENGVEMRLFFYFKKNDNNIWELYETRSYNGKNPGDWIYYNFEPIKNTIGQRYYKDFIRFKSDTGAYIDCVHCEFNAFINQTVTPTKGYSLEALLGQPAGSPIVISNDPKTSYAVRLLLKSNGVPVNDLTGYKFDWSATNNSLLNIQFNNETAQLTGIKPGNTSVVIKAYKENNEIASTSFNVTIKEVAKPGATPVSCVTKFNKVPVNSGAVCCPGLILVPTDDQIGVYGTCVTPCFTSSDCQPNEICALSKNNKPVCVQATNEKNNEVDVLKQDINKLKADLANTQTQQNALAKTLFAIQSFLKNIFGRLFRL